ncbi:hypothetical protein TA3x_005303 [Tundrisphaera sp. TA3]|uniref:hypothetical protein n=1 Tax=Tundrisphaera sp. TA3 TaxID=3435775 RepID=UPI003EBE8C93
MLSSSAGSPRRSQGRRASVWAGAAVLGLLTATGCQVEYAGMTLPSGKYMHDDVQYFAPGPDFPYANTQAATQRAKMAANGIAVPPPPGAAVEAPVAGMPGPNGIPAVPAPGIGIPRLGPMPEGEANAPGGPAAPNNVPGPGAGGDAPGGAMPPPF